MEHCIGSVAATVIARRWMAFCPSCCLGRPVQEVNICCPVEEVDGGVPFHRFGRPVREADGKTARRGGITHCAALRGTDAASVVLSRKWTEACPYITSAVPAMKWMVGHRLGSVPFAAWSGRLTAACPYRRLSRSVLEITDGTLRRVALRGTTTAFATPSRRWTVACPSVAFAALYGRWTTRRRAEAGPRNVLPQGAQPWQWTPVLPLQTSTVDLSRTGRVHERDVNPSGR